MKQIVDLTASFGPGKVSLVPGHPPVEYEMIHTHEKNHRTNAWISFSIHVGTHIDPPYHFKPTGKTIDELPLHFLAKRMSPICAVSSPQARGSALRRLRAVASHSRCCTTAS